MEQFIRNEDSDRTKEDLIEELKTLRIRQKTLVSSEELYQKMADSSSDALLVLDSQKSIRRCNRTFLKTFGFEDSSGPEGKSIKLFFATEKGFESWAGKMGNDEIADGGALTQESTLQRQDGSRFPAMIKTRPLRCGEDKRLNHVLCIRDLTSQKDQESKLAQANTHDFLTGLPNRVLLFDRLILAMLQSKRRSQPFAVMAMDVDCFKNINRTFGNAVADALLKGVADRLSALLRKEDTIARIDGDEFALLLADVGHQGNAIMIATKIVSSFRKPFSLPGATLPATLSIGISIFPDDGESPDELLRRAHLALRQVKETGRNGFQCYSPHLEYQS